MSYCYGPVPSRRLGFSLGVDLIPKKTCSFDCIYCQAGRTDSKIIRRNFYVNIPALKQELTAIIKKKPKIDYVTFSGAGEPTLHKDLDKIIRIIKKVTKKKYPLCLITNASLLSRKSVRRELKEVDLIVPSLDASCPEVFQKMNRPYPGISFQKVVRGLVQLRKEFLGKIWLEIMLVKGVNDSLADAVKFRELIDKIKPDKVQLNFPVRPAPVKLRLPADKRIKEIKKILGSNVEIAEYSHQEKQNSFATSRDFEILKYLRRRPATLEDLGIFLKADVSEIKKILKSMLKNRDVKEYSCRDKKYFVIND